MKWRRGGLGTILGFSPLEDGNEEDWSDEEKKERWKMKSLIL